jgi:quercetin dioxygenase-like cupin family protein
MCPCPHWGYVLKGRLTLQTKEGDQIYEAGQAFHWDPGHIPVALEDCDYVDFSPTEEFRQVIEHVKARLG